ncbi:hypothetical protein H6G74_24120 [Nostoc spongiaeforme FACHB-130]|uniref:Uncharacterized protein n=1 Tax=Nostoc spongiaeforme FACHB-130 TaxID=1357510 RepID=A0ABR8G2A3_9NOSO|nr:hypothetical protein [Nostoc spongiaeforme FACHB-130]
MKYQQKAVGGTGKLSFKGSSEWGEGVWEVWEGWEVWEDGEEIFPPTLPSLPTLPPLSILPSPQT